MSKHDYAYSGFFSKRNLPLWHNHRLSKKQLSEISDALHLEMPRPSEQQIQKKIDNICASMQYSADAGEETREKEYIGLYANLQRLARLPTGRLLLQALPDDTVFRADYDRLQEENAKGAFDPRDNTIHFNPYLKDCLALGHEIRHAIQCAHDPFACLVHENTKRLQLYSPKIMPMEHATRFETELDAAMITWQLVEEAKKYLHEGEYQVPPDFANYEAYQRLAKKLCKHPDSQKGRRIRNTMAFIDLWYGLTFDGWRRSYIWKDIFNGKKRNDPAEFGNIKLRSSWRWIAPEAKEELEMLNKEMLGVYLHSHDIKLDTNFFNEKEPTSVVIGGHKLFERVIDDNGATIATYDAEGNVMYAVRLDKNGMRTLKQQTTSVGVYEQDNPDTTVVRVERKVEKIMDVLSSKVQKKPSKRPVSYKRRKQKDLYGL